MHWLIFDVLSNRSIAILSTIPDHTRTCYSPMHTDTGTMPLTLTTSQVSARNGVELIGFMDSSQPGWRMSLFTKFGSAPFSSTIATVSRALDVNIDKNSNEISGFAKKIDAVSCELSSYCTTFEEGSCRPVN